MMHYLLASYAASILTISLLVLFAHHNRKSGWKKQPGRFTSWLQEYYGATVAAEPADLSTPDLIPNLRTATAAENLTFSTQLIQLRVALGTAAKVPAFHEDVDTRATATARSAAQPLPR